MTRLGSGSAYAAGAAALLVTLAGCGGQGILNTPQESEEPVTASPSTSASPTAKPKPSGKAVRFNGVVLYLPKGWRRGPVSDGTTCGLPPGQKDCIGGALTVKKQRTKKDWPTGVIDQPGGWQGPAQPICYAPGAIDPDHAIPNNARITVNQLFAIAGGLKAAYREWQVPCSSGKIFSVKLWFIAEKKVVFYVMGAVPEYGLAYDQIVKNAELG